MEKRIELERRARKESEITDLNLDNCRSTSIVGLTDEYTALESLSLINVGLTTLKGFPKLPNLKKLELSDNRISNGLHYLKTSPNLESLNLSGNKIKDLETLKPLQEFKQLLVLDLFNNEATQINDYREKIFEMLPSLKFLDGMSQNCANVSDRTDVIVSPISSAIFRKSVAMERFSGEERACCVREFYKNDNSPIKARRKFCQLYKLRHINKAPSTQLIKKWVQKFEETGSTLSKPRTGRPTTSISEENVENVRRSVRENPTLSVRQRASVLNVTKSSLHRIMRKINQSELD